MEIEKRVLDKLNAVEGEKITENLPILYEFILDQGYLWTKKQINYLYSSKDILEEIKYIINADVSNLDLKYCMYMNGVEGHIHKNGTAYYPIRKDWFNRIKQWADEIKDRSRAEEKYKRMKEQIREGTLNYRFI